MIDIFISYSRKDQDYVEWIKPVLKRLKIEENLNYYQDVENILPGEEFSNSIEDSISNATIIICFLSNNYFASDFIQKEEILRIERCYAKGTQVIPVAIENVHIESNSLFNKIQRANLNDKTLVELKKENKQDQFAVFFEKILRDEFKRFPLKKPKKSNVRYNLVVVGKAGVGKSELINYLFGQEVARSGIGKPVTEIGFHRIDFDILDIPASIFDSAGLEVGHYREWRQALDNELINRGTTDPLQKWFHTILYCVHATGLRIEPFELEIINQFLEERYRVIVVITKSYINKKKIDELANSIKKNINLPIKCIYVNSADEEIGEIVVKKFGKSQLSVEIKVSLLESLTERIPARCISFMAKYIDEKCDEQIRYINDNITIIPRNALADNIKLSLDKITNDVRLSDGQFNKIILRETREALSLYKEILGFVEQALFDEDSSFVASYNPDTNVPRIKSFATRLNEYFENTYDWDFSEKYGTAVDVISKVLTFPFVAMVSIFLGIGDYIDDRVAWRNNAIEKINSFKTNLKKEIWNGEEDIKKFFSDKFRGYGKN